MAYINEQQTLIKCEQCGKFTAEADAYYGKIWPGDDCCPADGFCDEKCYKRKRFNAWKNERGESWISLKP